MGNNPVMRPCCAEGSFTNCSDVEPNNMKIEYTEAAAHKDTYRLPLLKEAFEAADTDGSGWVSPEELAEFGQYIGNRTWAAKEIQETFKKTDKNADGKIDLEEFQDFCFEETKHISTVILQAMVHSYIEVSKLPSYRKQKMKAVYDKIDVTGIGHVQYAEMSEFGYFMSPKFDDTKLDKLMDQMDLNKDGTVSYYEFLGYFAKFSKESSDKQFDKAFAKYLEFQKGSSKSL
mmetsp:Transcript_7116/g.16271  ORF Transcript_7116/g.16271 Transcript_7116/m.16271 type:complete len:231 (-) Transcript_7116:229-921(-)